VELSRMICPRVQGAEGHECSVEVTSPRRMDLRSGVDRTCAALVSMRWVADSERAPRREPSSSGQVVRNRSWPHESDARAVRRGQEPYPGPVGGDVSLPSRQSLDHVRRVHQTDPVHADQPCLLVRLGLPGFRGQEAVLAPVSRPVPSIALTASVALCVSIPIVTIACPPSRG
jgi:hypothetical protein